jgi:hypothetical protein
MNESFHFSPKSFSSGQFCIDSSSLILSPCWRLQIDSISFDCAFNFPDIVFVDPLIGFDVLMLWQFGFIALDIVNAEGFGNYFVTLQPLGLQSNLYGDQFRWLGSSSDALDFSVYSDSACLRGTPFFSILGMLRDLEKSPIFKALLRLRSLAMIQPLVAPLLDLSPINRVSFLSKYAFCRSSFFQGVSERSLLTALSSPTDPDLKFIRNVSPTLRRGQSVHLKPVQDLVRAVFRKTKKGLIPLNPPISTFHRSTPSPGAFASCEAFILHGLPNTPSSLLFYDSLSDSFVDCLLDSSAYLQSLARHAHREATLNCQSESWISTIVVIASDLWTLERKYGPGAFSLASFEVGVLAEAVHHRLPQHQLAGCLCGSMQIWPLLTLAYQKRKLLPMLGYSLVRL